MLESFIVLNLKTQKKGFKKKILLRKLSLKENSVNVSVTKAICVLNEFMSMAYFEIEILRPLHNQIIASWPIFH